MEEWPPVLLSFPSTWGQPGEERGRRKEKSTSKWRRERKRRSRRMRSRRRSRKRRRRMLVASISIATLHPPILDGETHDSLIEVLGHLREHVNGLKQLIGVNSLGYWCCHCYKE